MMGVYESILEKRSDLTQWLIHWTHWKKKLKPIEVLYKIVEDGLLIPGWSVRGTVRTIYGPSPAVCFTEQPLREFATYADTRGDPTFVGRCGVIVHRSDAFAEGALPVISGLHNTWPVEKGEPGYEPPPARILQGLALEEQYRYVAFNPSKSPAIDWTHEREWRWRGNLDADADDETRGYFPLGGYPYAPKGKGRVHFFVNQDSSVAPLQRHIAKVIAACKASDSPYRKRYAKALGRARIFSLETVRREVKSDASYSKVDTHPW